MRLKIVLKSSLVILFAFAIHASEMKIKLNKSFFPKKEITIDADSPDRIIVEYDLLYYISDGCAADVITSYKLGGCPRKKYKTLRKESKYIIELEDSSARKGKGPQTIRLSVKQEEKDSYDIVPVITILDGNEDQIKIEDPWFSATKVTLKSRDRVINQSQSNQKGEVENNQSNRKNNNVKSHNQ
ncbi:MULTISPECIES: hypothetical protein [Pseudomonadati]|uniref:hypothetical protein n=1 Tax=unclassified Halobacteriovorax TaxID=2639665 RepID=UPI000CD1D230|nr:hypothetical protein [Halobacteriovorax sp. DA5]POB12876.1 hypothetical protein C0Z22_13440 [Halobacteriovorax sp. DA5]